jgi:hypothetical protein
VELPAGLHRRLEIRLVLRLSHHLLGVFLLEEGERVLCAGAGV